MNETLLENNYLEKAQLEVNKPLMKANEIYMRDNGFPMCNITTQILILVYKIDDKAIDQEIEYCIKNN